MKEGREDLFYKYLKEAEIFIVDNSQISRSRLAKIMIEMGAQSSKITTFAKYDQAEEALVKSSPKILICDYDLGKKSGFDLLQIHRENHPNTKKSMFVLVTSNTSQSLVAQAAEEDIDTFILKPYTLNVIKEILLRTFMNKIHPSDYAIMVENGKKLLFAGEPHEAMTMFAQAIELSTSPTLAYFYYGQAKLMILCPQEAEEKYKAGLSYNRIHYKCLCRLYDLLLKMERNDEAYEIIRTLADYFPANPNRLASVLHLAFKTQNYQDIEGYFQKFLEIDIRSDEVTSAISAALTVCGRYYLQQRNFDQAIALFDKVNVATKEKARFARIIMEYLTIYGAEDYLPKFLKKFPQETRGQRDYLIADFFVKQKSLPTQQRIQTAQDFIKMNIENYVIYYILIESLASIERFEEADKFLNDAVLKWKNERTTFNRIANRYSHKIKGRETDQNVSP